MSPNSNMEVLISIQRKSFSGVFKRGLVLFSLNNFSIFFYFFLFYYLVVLFLADIALFTENYPSSRIISSDYFGKQCPYYKGGRYSTAFYLSLSIFFVDFFVFFELLFPPYLRYPAPQKPLGWGRGVVNMKWKWAPLPISIRSEEMVLILICCSSLKKVEKFISVFENIWHFWSKTEVANFEQL